MSTTTKIQWTEHTGGPWLGCTKCSGGCGHCYACGLAETRHQHFFRNAYKLAGFPDWETRPIWGDTAPRILTRGFWDDARAINRKHAKAGTRGKHFPSLIDWLDLMPAGIIDQDGRKLDPIAVLADFLKVVHECTHIDWLLLTKRPENWLPLLQKVERLASDEYVKKEGTPFTFYQWISDWVMDTAVPPNIWIGVSIEDQRNANVRLPALLEIPAKLRFLSCEPLLGEVNLTYDYGFRTFLTEGIHWVIAGGESGPGARVCDLDWLRSLRDQCAAAQVPFFMKQLGKVPRELQNGRSVGFGLKDKKGGDPAEWPEDLRLRQFPAQN